ncbi:MAG TPA: CoA transferase [Roseomonas sp.]|nr:CoA transferase [Roseomonas sp.]
MAASGAAAPWSRGSPWVQCDVVHVAVSCFGSGGPFADRAGWEQVAQAVTGICETQGLLDDFAMAPEVLTEAQLAPLHRQEQSVYGDLRTLGPVLRMSATLPSWDRPTPRLGGDDPVWLPRA